MSVKLYIIFAILFICILSTHASFTSFNPFSTAPTPIPSNELAAERTFVAIKPDAVQRNLVGEIISRFERKGLKLTAIRIVTPTVENAIEQYIDLKGASFFDDLIGFITSGPLVAMIWEGVDAVSISRKLIGATHPDAAQPGTIRGDFCLGKGKNLVHSSDSLAAAERELKMWFGDSDIVVYDKTIQMWVTKKD